MGQPFDPSARYLLATEDANSSNGNRLRLWKLELQKLADEIDHQIAIGSPRWHPALAAITTFIPGVNSRQAIVAQVQSPSAPTGS
jgi:hypothetical protein